jgi:hypothetical protein
MSPYAAQIPRDRPASSHGIPMLTGPDGQPRRANAQTSDGRYIYDPRYEVSSSGPPQPAEYGQHDSPYRAPAAVGVPDATAGHAHANGLTHSRQVSGSGRDVAGDERGARAIGEAVSAEPVVRDDANGDRAVVDEGGAENGDVGGAAGGGEVGAGGFTAVNN